VVKQNMIDMVSDTVTLPTNEMREAMFNAEVGDDVLEEDPTVNKLESLAVKKIGKEAALFIPGGTMGNAVVILTHCKRGHEMIVERTSHIFECEVRGDGIEVNKKIVEAGALLYYIGLAKVCDDNSPEHSVIGADMIRKLGFPERVALCS